MFFLVAPANNQSLRGFTDSLVPIIIAIVIIIEICDMK